MDIGLTTKLDFVRSQRNVSVTLAAPSGAISVIVGPSGSGKTTLLRLLAGLLRPDKGFIRVEGVPWYDQGKGIHLPPQQRRVGMVFQDYALFPHMSALENVAFARRDLEDRRAARSAAAGAVDECPCLGRTMTRPLPE